VAASDVARLEEQLAHSLTPMARMM
jgi:hypothetical protein